MKSGLPKGIAAFIGAAAAMVLIAPFLIVLKPGPAIILVVFAVTLLAAGVFLWWTFSAHNKDDGSSRVKIARSLYLDACTVRSAIRSTIESCNRDCAAAHALYDGLLQAVQSRLNELLHADFDQMTGPDFENFLAEVFESLGHKAEHTGQTGDHGIDLIVQNGPVRIAVQARCSQGLTGNFAVQDALAGKAQYACQCCAVITNADFSESARQLARSVDCQLIDGQTLPDLIRGSLQIGTIVEQEQA